MATTINQLASVVVLLGLLITLKQEFTVAQTGVCYGREGNNLPSPAEVVALYNQNNIQRMRIYDPDQPTLQALSGSNIELILGVPNTDLQNLASSQDNANTWVQNNVRNYPNVRFRYISVGNEVSPLKSDTSQYAGFVLPALQNIDNAISAAGLGNQIRVSTALETTVLGKDFPPEDGVFKDEVRDYLNGIITFLVNTRAPLLVNIYPYFAYINNKANIDLQYALFTSDGIDVGGGIRYQNLFYAILDAMYAALEKSGGSSLEIVVSESGWPSAGGDTTSVDFARTYNTNLIQRVRDGTPKRPGRAIETYIFAMFDENQKNGDEIERHFGIFTPDRQPKYPISFN
ncbi:Glucan endo-1,3-beta-D-glucosidase [Handroanthus impetiginosus]|uniref:Glucan endo-1,3-beta-D-glucosidase n=1 Tax=Handroanthus impetiginosus TaxID=429701 RepID=A0A2G9GBQ5_9LAMI|nr:Glucan endo-1,3-beta-D-glucosidase [Handroanthus impetiginosus]